MTTPKFDIESAALAAFGELPDDLSTPDNDDSLFVDWATANLFTGKLCFNGPLGWLHFDGIRWAPIEQVVIIEYLRLALESIRQRAIELRASRRDIDAIGVLARRHKLKSTVELMQGSLYVDANAFDADKDIVVTRNGVLDLKTGVLHDHSPTFLVTKAAGAEYRKGLTHPDIDKMFQALESDEVKWLQSVIGQGLSGRTTPDDKLVLFHGGGSNGKSVIINSVIKAAGDYAVFLPREDVDGQQVRPLNREDAITRGTLSVS